MDAKTLYIALNRVLNRVRWDRRGQQEYVVIGDGTEIDAAVLQSILDDTFEDSSLLVSIDRRTAFHTDCHTSAAEFIECIGPPRRAIVTDIELRKILQIDPIGVARTGTAPSSLRAAFKFPLINNKPCDSENSV